MIFMWACCFVFSTVWRCASQAETRMCARTSEHAWLWYVSVCFRLCACVRRSQCSSPENNTVVAYASRVNGWMEMLERTLDTEYARSQWMCVMMRANAGRNTYHIWCILLYNADLILWWAIEKLTIFFRSRLNERRRRRKLLCRCASHSILTWRHILFGQYKFNSHLMLIAYTGNRHHYPLKSHQCNREILCNLSRLLFCNDFCNYFFVNDFYWHFPLKCAISECESLHTMHRTLLVACCMRYALRRWSKCAWTYHRRLKCNRKVRTVHFRSAIETASDAAYLTHLSTYYTYISNNTRETWNENIFSFNICVDVECVWSRSGVPCASTQS